MWYRRCCDFCPLRMQRAVHSIFNGIPRFQICVLPSDQWDFLLVDWFVWNLRGPKYLQAIFGKCWGRSQDSHENQTFGIFWDVRNTNALQTFESALCAGPIPHKNISPKYRQTGANMPGYSERQMEPCAPNQNCPSEVEQYLNYPIVSSNFHLIWPV